MKLGITLPLVDIQGDPATVRTVPAFRSSARIR